MHEVECFDSLARRCLLSAFYGALSFRKAVPCLYAESEGTVILVGALSSLQILINPHPVDSEILLQDCEALFIIAPTKLKVQQLLFDSSTMHNQTHMMEPSIVPSTSGQKNSSVPVSFYDRGLSLSVQPEFTSLAIIGEHAANESKLESIYGGRSRLASEASPRVRFQPRARISSQHAYTLQRSPSSAPAATAASLVAALQGKDSQSRGKHLRKIITKSTAAKLPKHDENDSIEVRKLSSFGPIRVSKQLPNPPILRDYSDSSLPVHVQKEQLAALTRARGWIAQDSDVEYFSDEAKVADQSGADSKVIKSVRGSHSVIVISTSTHTVEHVSIHVFILPLVYFLRAIRQYSNEFIYVLSDRADEASDCRAEVLSAYPNLFDKVKFVQGLPRSPEHLIYCRVQSARTVAIIKPLGATTASEMGQPPTITISTDSSTGPVFISPDSLINADRHSIVTSLNLHMFLDSAISEQRSMQQAFTMTEIAHEANIVFLRQETLRQVC